MTHTYIMQLCLSENAGMMNTCNTLLRCMALCKDMFGTAFHFPKMIKLLQILDRLFGHPNLANDRTVLTKYF